MPNLYSTQSKIACNLARLFFEERHFVYAAPHFDAKENHPTSNPLEIRKLWCEVCGLTEAEYDLLFTSEGKLRDKANLSDYSMLKRWFEPLEDGGSGQDDERWQAHLNTLTGVAASVLLAHNVALFQQAINLIANATRMTDGLPVIYRISITESRLKGSTYDPGPEYPGHKEYIVPDLDISTHSTEAKVFDLGCDHDVREEQLV